MSDFRTKVLQETQEFNLSDIVPLYDSSTKTSYINYLSNILDGDIIKSGLIKTGYIPYKTNPKCYPLELDDEGRAYAEIQRTDTFVSAIEYDDANKFLILKLNDPLISDISVPVSDMVQKYYADEITISSKGNVFGICDGVLHQNGNYISAFSESEDYRMSRTLSNETQQRDPVSFLNCVRTDTDYEICKNGNYNTILDYRDINNPVLEYYYEDEKTPHEIEGFRRINLTSYSQLQSEEYGTDIRVGEFIYNNTTRKLWYMKSKELSDIIQLDEDLVKITVTNGQSESLIQTGSGIYTQEENVQIGTQAKSPDDRFTFIGWQDGNNENPRTVKALSTCTYTAIYKDANIIDYYDSAETTKGFGTDYKCLSAGRYYAIGIGSGGSGSKNGERITETSQYWNDSIAGYVRNVATMLVMTTGGSGEFISCFFEISSNKDCVFTTNTKNVSTTLQATDGSLNIYASGGDNMNKGQNSYCTGEKVWDKMTNQGENGNYSYYEYFAYDRGGAICYDSNGPFSAPGGGRRTQLYKGSNCNRNTAKYYGGGYPKSGLNYGAGTSFDGSNKETKGYLHVERYMEVRFLDYNGNVIKDKQYIIRNNRVPEIPSNPIRAGYTFTGWSQDPKSYIINNDYDIIAQYTPNQINVVTKANDSTMGYVLGAGTYYCDQIILLQAFSNVGYKFLYWDDDHTLTSNIRQLTVPIEDTTYTAVFSKDLIITYFDNI